MIRKTYHSRIRFGSEGLGWGVLNSSILCMIYLKRNGTVPENNELFSRIVLFVKGEGEGSEQMTDF